MKVTAILKGRIDSNKEQPIQIRVSDSGKRTFEPTRIKIKPSQWDKEAGKVKNHPKATEYNNTIRDKIIIAQAKAISSEARKPPKVDLYAYIKEHFNEVDKIREAGTLRQYNSQLKKLKSFKPTIYLHEINREFLSKYRSHLYSIGNSVNTVWSSFKFLRSIIRKAYKNGLIAQNPFNGFEFPKYQEPDKAYLTDKELKKIEDYLIKHPNSEINKYGWWFLIACYTGMRRQDLLAFTKEKNIVQGRLVVKTIKQKEVIGMKVQGKLKELFEKVNYEPLKIHPDSYNPKIKTIILAAGIEKNVASHTARHTAAMTMANAGMSQETVAKILAHKDLRSTATYYKISNKRIDDEMKKLG